MTYLALARRYRPGTFAEVIGQEHIVRTLQNAIRLNRVHHAYLFAGVRGVGKTTTARILARALNCEQGPTVEPCCQCISCKEITQGTSPDVVEIDGASNTGVDHIRDLRENVAYAPLRGKSKVYIIDEVHMLSQAAFNALLKTLEEPPLHIKFIFATTESHKIPVTILSRCQRFHFKRVSNQLLVQHLKSILEQENIHLSDFSLRVLVDEAEGSVRDALSFLDQMISYAGESPSDALVLEALGALDRHVLFQLFDAIVRKNAKVLLELIDTIDTHGHDLHEIASLLLTHVRDLMLVQLGDDVQQRLDRSPSELEILKQQTQQLTTIDLQRMFSVLTTVAEDVSRSAWPRLSLEMGLLRLLDFATTPTLKTLLERLDALLQNTPSSQKNAQAEPEKRPENLPQTLAVSVAPQESKNWLGFVDKVRQIRPALSSLLEHAHVLVFTDASVTLGFREATFYLESARETKNREQLTNLARQFLQNNQLEVQIQAVKADEVTARQSVHDAQKQEIMQEKKQLQKDAVEDPMIKEAVAVLGGQIEQVMTWNKSNQVYEAE